MFLENKLIMSLFFFIILQSSVFSRKKNFKRRKISNRGKNIISPKNRQKPTLLSENWQILTEKLM